MTRFCYVGIIFLFMSFYGSALSQKKDSLTLYSLKSEKLGSIIDSFIGCEKRCDYYGDDLNFLVSFDNDSFIQISSFKKTTISEKNKGYFVKDGFVWLLAGRRIDTSLFINKSNKKAIRSFDFFKKESQNLSIDDRFTFWIYKIKDGELVYYGKNTYCE